MVEFRQLLRLAEASDGPPDAAAIAALYAELRRLACGTRADTLPTTASANRPQFFAAAATTLRRMLVEHGRKRSRRQRGTGFVRLLELDAALDRLASFDLAKA